MIVLPARPCYYDDGICADCTGEPDDCRRLIAQDQTEDDE